MRDACFHESEAWWGASRLHRNSNGVYKIPHSRLNVKLNQQCPGKMGTAKTQQGARTVSGSIGRSAASPLTAPAALRFAPCKIKAGAWGNAPPKKPISESANQPQLGAR